MENLSQISIHYITHILHNQKLERKISSSNTTRTSTPP